MSDYNRSTKACSLAELRPELSQAIHDYVELNQALRDYVRERRWNSIEEGIVMCCETTSTRKHSDILSTLMGEDTIYYTGLLFTPDWLIWVRSGDKSGIQVFSANFKDVQVAAYHSKLVKDTGLEVVGYMGDPPRRMRGYIGLGPEEAARQFCEAVKQAEEKVTKSARPKRRIKLGWW